MHETNVLWKAYSKVNLSVTNPYFTAATLTEISSGDFNWNLEELDEMSTKVTYTAVLFWSYYLFRDTAAYK